MESVALDLKSEREKRKISLAQISAETRIGLRHLQSLEEGRFGDLPGGLYNRAFLKAYCESINLDPTEILERYETQLALAQPEKSTRYMAPLPEQGTFSSLGPIVIWSILLLASAAGIYWSRGWISDLFSPYFPDKSPVAGLDHSAPSEPASIRESAISESVEPASGQAAETEYPESEAPSLETLSPGPEVESPASMESEGSTAGLKVVRDTESAVPDTAAAAKLRLEISATEQCWVSIDRDGIPSIRKLMEPGETQTILAEENVRILLGNAGGVQMKINGKPAKPLGNPGEVIRITIDTENLQQYINPSAG